MAKVQERIRTGVRNTTIPNPAYGQKKAYVGTIEKFTGWVSKVQEKNSEVLIDILKKNGLRFNHFFEFTHEGYGSYTESDRYNKVRKMQQFIAVVGDLANPTLVWYKYEGAAAGGGKNLIYVKGEEHKLSDFVGSSYRPYTASQIKKLLT